MLKKLAIITEDRYENPEKVEVYEQNILREEEILERVFQDMGWECNRLSWSNTDVNWGDFDALLLRSTWDYFYRFSEFSAWVEKVAKQSTLINSKNLIAWNWDKKYLFDLQGIRIPPTQLLEKGGSYNLPFLAKEKAWETVVIKPCISGAAKNTFKVERNELDNFQKQFDSLIEEEDYLIQEFLKEVPKHGEYSLVFFGENFSHAVIKNAKPGDFRVQDDFGGTVKLVEPKKELLDFGRAVLHACPELPAYARVDICIDNQGAYCLAELELIEPELWFRLKPKAAELFIETLQKHNNTQGLFV